MEFAFKISFTKPGIVNSLAVTFIGNPNFLQVSAVTGPITAEGTCSGFILVFSSIFAKPSTVDELENVT